MGRNKNKGKSWQNLVKMLKKSPPVQIELKKKPKVIIDRDFVDEYMKKTPAAAAAPLSNSPTIEIDSDDENDDVVFVQIIKPPEISPKTKEIATMRKEMSNLRRQNQKLNERLGNMESAFLNMQETTNQNENAACIETDASLVLSQSDDEWLTHEINDLAQNGQLENAFSDLLNEMN